MQWINLEPVGWPQLPQEEEGESHAAEPETSSTITFGLSTVTTETSEGHDVVSERTHGQCVVTVSNSCYCCSYSARHVVLFAGIVVSAW
jgi:hypothetical protein